MFVESILSSPSLVIFNKKNPKIVKVRKPGAKVSFLAFFLTMGGLEGRNYKKQVAPMFFGVKLKLRCWCIRNDL